MRAVIASLAVLLSTEAVAQVKPGEPAPEPDLIRHELGQWKSPLGWTSTGALVLSYPSTRDYAKPPQLWVWTRGQGLSSPTLPADMRADPDSMCIDGDTIQWLEAPPISGPRPPASAGRAVMRMTVDAAMEAPELKRSAPIIVSVAPLQYQIVLDTPDAPPPQPAIFTPLSRCVNFDPALDLPVIRAMPELKEADAVDIRPIWGDDGYIVTPKRRSAQGAYAFDYFEGYPEYRFDLQFRPLPTQALALTPPGPLATALGTIEVVDLAREPDPIRAQAQLVRPSGERIGLATAQPDMTFRMTASPDGCVVSLHGDRGFRQPVLRQSMGRFGGSGTLTVIDLCDEANRDLLEGEAKTPG